MPTVAPTFTPPSAFSTGDGSVVQFNWALNTANSDGAGIEMVEWADVCFSFTSSSWGGAVAAVEGSNDGTNWLPLSNAAGGTAASTSAANKLFTIIERPRYIRPNLTTPGAGAVVTAIATLRRAQPLRV